MNFIQFENILGYQKKQTIDFNLIRNKNKLCGIFGKNDYGKYTEKFRRIIFFR